MTDPKEPQTTASIRLTRKEINMLLAIQTEWPEGFANKLFAALQKVRKS